MSLDIIKDADKLGKISREFIQASIDQMGKNTSFNSWRYRRDFNRLFGWSVPCKEAVDAIKKYIRPPLYDVMGGTGYWGRILRNDGIDVRTSDIHKILSKNGYHRKTEDDSQEIQDSRTSPKTHIRRRNALRVGFDIKNQRIKGDLFLSWPPYECPIASDLLDMLPIGTRVVYIGEGAGGCTGELSFHKNLETNFKSIIYVELPTFIGINDGMDIYEKIKDEKEHTKYRGKIFDWS